MTAPIFDLRATHNPHRWYLPITEAICVGLKSTPFMLGGVGLAASITALERTCGRPLIWATAQYLSFARPPAFMDLDVRAPVSGAKTTQARVIAHVGDQEILTVVGALGKRASIGEGQWVKPPDAPPPAQCRETLPPAGEVGGVTDSLELRVAHGRFRSDPLDGHPSLDGRLVLWVRPRQEMEEQAGVLAVIADYLPSAVSHALGKSLMANSLDNTLRIGRLTQTDWILCDMTLECVHDGFAHGSLRMFSERGELMAIGGQSMIVRARGAGA
jgi:acyl-CoA thioesterase